MSEPAGFASLVTQWQQAHGRHHLPWQNTRDPYCVWLSEIMLQQTQVATVLNYYGRFLQHFPNVGSLAQASEDDVLALWSGLGYYSRARNLHRCAKQVVAEHGGVFPRSAQALAQLPGIGRSTANAIAAFCFGERVAILDANVRRVLGRVLAFGQDLSKAANVQQLWNEATELLPREELLTTMPQYTQGMMDIGAQLCLPRKPQCLICPVASVCQAQKQGDATRYPVQTRKLKRTSQAWWLLLLQREDGSVWLQKRPAKGIWAGLHAPPVFASEFELRDHLHRMQLSERPQYLPAIAHVLTHMDLQLLPVVVVCHARSAGALPVTAEPGVWQQLTPESLDATGLPAPIRILLEGLALPVSS